MDLRKLESFVFDKMTQSRLPGLSIALVRDQSIVYERGFGQRDVRRGLPATPNTLYCIGSVTKSFTALATLQLVEEGLLELDAPVDAYLPFPVKPKGEQVLVRHLLTHATGIPALAYSEAVIRHANDTGGRALPIAGPEDVLTFMQDAAEWVETRPGERWFYFNEGYALLGLLIQRLSGMPYHVYIFERILEPLGMTRSYFRPEDFEHEQDVAVPYVLPWDGQPEPGRYVYRTIRSEGGLISSVRDLTRYLRVFMEGGAGVVSKASLEAMTQPRVPLPHKVVPELFGLQASEHAAAHYGYGLGTQPDFYGQTLVEHGGSVLVATAHLAFLPEAGLGVAVLANGSGYPMGQIAQVALALMLERDPNELPFLRIERALEGLSGPYETYKGTMQAAVARHGDFLTLTFHDRAQPQVVTLVPERLAGDELTFFTLSGGRRLEVIFRRSERSVELLYERYKLKKS
jgi:CubicO group peptidase (beta-lactamase class C family)